MPEQGEDAQHAQRQHVTMRDPAAEPVHNLLITC